MDAMDIDGDHPLQVQGGGAQWEARARELAPEDVARHPLSAFLYDDRPPRMPPPKALENAAESQIVRPPPPPRARAHAEATVEAREEGGHEFSEHDLDEDEIVEEEVPLSRPFIDQDGEADPPLTEAPAATSMRDPAAPKDYH